MELGPNMLERNSEDLWSELEEIKPENKTKNVLHLTTFYLNFRKLWRNVF